LAVRQAGLQIIDRIKAVYERYDVDPRSPDAGLRLVLRMMFDLFPGFSVEETVSPRRKAGRPRRRTENANSTL